MTLYSHCGEEIPETLIKKLIAMGKDRIICPICGDSIPIKEITEGGIDQWSKERMALQTSHSSFLKLIRGGYLYVDKTEHVYKLVKRDGLYFLSRPRRFGKSLLISTFKALFQAQKELFKGLWIDRHGNWEWTEHPVVIFDFNSISHGSYEELKAGLLSAIDLSAKDNGIKLANPLLVERFRELIRGLKEKTGHDVVILVDEYDKPMIDFIGQGKEKLEIGKANRDLLKAFYGVLKGADITPVLRFVFITGVSKFSKVSIFSELNNLYDLTMDKQYNDLVGYTHGELIEYFEPWIRDLAEEYKSDYEKILDRLITWYNGYRFSEKDVKVYNPFSILNILMRRSFKNYWFESGSSSFLINLLKEKVYNLTEYEELKVSSDRFSVYDIDNLEIQPLLFQTGYLTIVDYDEDELKYTLTYPNFEVKSSFVNMLANTIKEFESTHTHEKILSLRNLLHKEKYDEFFEALKSIYGSIPYVLCENKDEAYFHSLFYLMMCGAGMQARSEVLTAEGRIDMVIEFWDKIYIVEFKCNQSPEIGIKQIKDKDYTGPYVGGRKNVYLMGINFSTEKRNVVEWKREIYEKNSDHGG